MTKVPKCRRKIAENFNRLSRVHERYRQTDRQTERQTTDDRQTTGADGRRQHIAKHIRLSNIFDITNVNVSSRSLKNSYWYAGIRL